MNTIDVWTERQVHIIVNFDCDGQHIGPSRCIATEDSFVDCVARAGAAAERFAATVR